MDQITRRLHRTHQCELLVVGSGVAGMTAALQAARLGLDTILLEKESVLGGNSGPLLGIHWGGAHLYHDYAAETGIVMELEEEIAYRGGKHRTPDHHYNISRLAEGIWQEKLEEAGVRVLKRHVAREAEVAAGEYGRRVVGVVADDTALLHTVRIEISHAVIDASGDGQVAFSAGAPFRYGREAAAEFHERNAPETADRRVAGVSLTAFVRRSEAATPFLPPAGSYDIALNTQAAGWLGEHDNVRMLWPTETGGTLLDPLTDEHLIYERLLKQFYHYWADLKQNPSNADWELVWVSPIAGKRETRRFIGDYTLTQTHLETPATLPDRVGYGGFTIDQHEQGEDGLNRIFMYSAPPLYDTCYRMTYSCEFENLYLAGRLISSTHLAHGSTRIIKTGGLLAQATAIAVALAKERGCTARGVHAQYLEDLQQEVLRQDGSIADLPADDWRDLARNAQVWASSEWFYRDFEPTERRAASGCGLLLHDWPATLSSVSAYVVNPGDQARPLRLSVAAAQSRPPELLPRPEPGREEFFQHLFKVEAAVSQLTELCAVSVEVPPGFEGLREIDLGRKLPLPERSRRQRHQGVALRLEGEGLEVGVAPAPCDAAQIMEFVEDGSFTLQEGRLALLPDGAVPLGECENVTNGVSRRWGRVPLNMWVSAPGERLPQWLELQWDEPQQIGSVSLTFDGIGRRYTDMPFNDGTRVFGPLVKDYRIEAQVGESWQELVVVRDNYHRFRRHEFEPVETVAVRIVVEEVNDERYGARVAEVRVERSGDRGAGSADR